MLFFEKKQTMPDFLPQSDQHVRLPVQTPRRSNFETSSTAHEPRRGAFRVERGDSNMLLIHLTGPVDMDRCRIGFCNDFVVLLSEGLLVR